MRVATQDATLGMQVVFGGVQEMLLILLPREVCRY